MPPKESRQNLLFSATWPSVVHSLAGQDGGMGMEMVKEWSGTRWLLVGGFDMFEHVPPWGDDEE